MAVPRAEQDSLLALLGTATLAAYPETGHAVHWERPGEVARGIGEFIGRSAP
jgi:pimeloyl-ACP methyl ester carboxylesterase